MAGEGCIKEDFGLLAAKVVGELAPLFCYPASGHRLLPEMAALVALYSRPFKSSGVATSYPPSAVFRDEDEVASIAALQVSTRGWRVNGRITVHTSDLREPTFAAH